MPTHDLWAALETEINMYLRNLSLADARQVYGYAVFTKALHQLNNDTHHETKR